MSLDINIALKSLTPNFIKTIKYSDIHGDEKVLEKESENKYSSVPDNSYYKREFGKVLPLPRRPLGPKRKPPSLSKRPLRQLSSVGDIVSASEVEPSSETISASEEDPSVLKYDQDFDSIERYIYWSALDTESFKNKLLQVPRENIFKTYINYASQEEQLVKNKALNEAYTKVVYNDEKLKEALLNAETLQYSDNNTTMANSIITVLSNIRQRLKAQKEEVDREMINKKIYDAYIVHELMIHRINNLSDINDYIKMPLNKILKEAEKEVLLLENEKTVIFGEKKIYHQEQFYEDIPLLIRKIRQDKINVIINNQIKYDEKIEDALKDKFFDLHLNRILSQKYIELPMDKYEDAKKEQLREYSQEEIQSLKDSLYILKDSPNYNTQVNNKKWIKKCEKELQKITKSLEKERPPVLSDEDIEEISAALDDEWSVPKKVDGERPIDYMIRCFEEYRAFHKNIPGFFNKEYTKEELLQIFNQTLSYFGFTSKEEYYSKLEDAVKVKNIRQIFKNYYGKFQFIEKFNIKDVLDKNYEKAVAKTDITKLFNITNHTPFEMTIDNNILKYPTIYHYYIERLLADYVGLQKNFKSYNLILTNAKKDFKKIDDLTNTYKKVKNDIRLDKIRYFTRTIYKYFLVFPSNRVMLKNTEPARLVYRHPNDDLLGVITIHKHDTDNNPMYDTDNNPIYENRGYNIAGLILEEFRKNIQLTKEDKLEIKIANINSKIENKLITTIKFISHLITQIYYIMNKVYKLSNINLSDIKTIEKIFSIFLLDSEIVNMLIVNSKFVEDKFRINRFINKNKINYKSKFPTVDINQDEHTISIDPTKSTLLLNNQKNPVIYLIRNNTYTLNIQTPNTPISIIKDILVEDSYLENDISHPDSLNDGLLSAKDRSMGAWTLTPGYDTPDDIWITDGYNSFIKLQIVNPDFNFNSLNKPIAFDNTLIIGLIEEIKKDKVLEKVSVNEYSTYNSEKLNINTDLTSLYRKISDLSYALYKKLKTTKRSKRKVENSIYYLNIATFRKNTDLQYIDFIKNNRSNVNQIVINKVNGILKN